MLAGKKYARFFARSLRVSSVAKNSTESNKFNSDTREPVYMPNILPLQFQLDDCTSNLDVLQHLYTFILWLAVTKGNVNYQIRRTRMD